MCILVVRDDIGVLHDVVYVYGSLTWHVRYVCGRCVVTIGDPEVQYQHTLATHVEEFSSWCVRAF